ncbi:MAG: tRNA (guanosine(46)-N7)-methyltransferase TrmB [Verrucomicrobia bacterium]|nr:tRNA (guanosine(46)-N7)-methyltransferase TrmB [Verrucomicrobiota bacterium]
MQIFTDERAPDAAFEVFPDTILTPIPLGEIFARPQPVEVDLGSGSGQFLIEASQRYPDHNFLGVERLLGRVRKTRRRAWKLGLQNLRVLRFEIDYTVRYLLPPGSIWRFHLSFPDPWPKRRHQRRRVVDQAFFEAVHTALQTRGELWIKTDHAEYFATIRKLVPQALFHLAEWVGDDYPSTDFEDLFALKQLPIYRLRLLKAN